MHVERITVEVIPKIGVGRGVGNGILNSTLLPCLVHGPEVLVTGKVSNNKTHVIRVVEPIDQMVDKSQVVGPHVSRIGEAFVARQKFALKTTDMTHVRLAGIKQFD